MKMIEHISVFLAQELYGDGISYLYLIRSHDQTLHQVMSKHLVCGIWCSKINCLIPWAFILSTVIKNKYKCGMLTSKFYSVSVYVLMLMSKLFVLIIILMLMSKLFVLIL